MFWTNHFRRRAGAVTAAAFVSLAAAAAPASLSAAPRGFTDSVVQPSKFGQSRLTELPPRARRADAGATTGARTVAVIRITFTDATTPVGTDDSIRAAFRGADAIFREESQGQLALNGTSTQDVDVFGPVAVDFASSECATRRYDMANQGADIAQQLGYDASRYDHTAFLFPTAHCPAPWAGLALMPGNALWLNNTLEPTAIAHELGHNLGLGHAEALDCEDMRGDAVALSSDCTVNAYGDRFDTMGDQTGVLLSSWRRWKLGVLPASTAQVVTSGRVTLTDTNAAGFDGTRVVLVPRPGVGADGDGYFALEFRGPGRLFDQFSITDPVANGVTIRLVSADGADLGSRLIDTNPGDFGDAAALATSRSFEDPISGAVISTISARNGQAVVEINGAPLSQAGSAAKRSMESTSVSLIAPKLVRHRGRISKSGRVVVGVAGSSRVAVKINGKTVRRAFGSRAALKLTKTQLRSSRITVVATGGLLSAPVRAAYTVRAGVITQR